MAKREVKFGNTNAAVAMEGEQQSLNERDSEFPSDSEEEEERRVELNPMGQSSPGSNIESEYDPRLEQKIEQIKLNLRSGSNTNSQTNTATHAGGITSHTGEQKNVAKLEEVLQRQRDRLDHIQN